MVLWIASHMDRQQFAGLPIEAAATSQQTVNVLSEVQSTLPQWCTLYIEQQVYTHDVAMLL